MTRFYLRIAMVVILLAGAGLGTWWLFASPLGEQIRSDPMAIASSPVAQHVREFVVGHPVTAPLVFIAVYTLLGLLLLPVWWMQFLAGFAFGMWEGVPTALAGAVCSATLATTLSKWLAGDWVRQQLEPRMDRLRRMNEKLGRNGLLVVVAVRLAHVMPFGMSNYAFGLTHISPRDSGCGTLMGNLPGICFCVAVGTGLDPRTSWRRIIILGAINALLMVPLLLRYIRPKWFEKIGIE